MEHRLTNIAPTNFAEVGLEKPPIILDLSGQQLVIPWERAQESATLATMIRFNQAAGAVDYSFSIPLQQLPFDVTADAAWQELLLDYLRYIFQDEPAPTEAPQGIVLDVLEILRQLDYFRDDYKDAKQLARIYLEKSDLSELPDLTLATWLVKFSLDFVNFMRRVSDSLYQNDSFTPQILSYFSALIRTNEQVAYALQPHGYPFTRAEQLDQIMPIDRNIFLLDPFRTTESALPDYMGAEYVVAVPINAYTVPPKPEIKIDRAAFLERLLTIFPKLLDLHEKVRVQLTNLGRFNPEAGFVICGSAVPVALDDWLYTHFRLKASIEIHIYGPDEYARATMSSEIRNWLDNNYPSTSYFHAQWRNSLVVAQLGDIDQYKALGLENAFPFALRLIPSVARTPFELLSRQRFSHLQVGYDLHRGLICTPLFSLYFRKRESVIAWYGVTGAELVVNAYLGFALKMIAPYAHVLREDDVKYTAFSPMAIVAPISTYGDLVEYTTDITLIKGRPVLILPTQEPYRPANTPYPRFAELENNDILGESGNYNIITAAGRTLPLSVLRWETGRDRLATHTEWINYDIPKANPSVNPAKGNDIVGLTNIPRSFFFHGLPNVDAAAIVEQQPGNLGVQNIGSFFLMRNCRFTRATGQYQFPRGYRPAIVRPGELTELTGVDFEGRLKSIPPFQIDQDPTAPILTYPLMPAGPNLIHQQLAVPSDPVDLSGLATGRAEFPITIEGIIQLVGNREIITEEGLREPLVLTEEEMYNMQTIDFRRLETLLAVADPEGATHMQMYERLLGYYGNPIILIALQLEIPGIVIHHAEIKAQYDQGFNILLQEEQEGVRINPIPRYVKVRMDIIIDKWFFIDEANWLIPFEDLFKYEFNCAMRKDLNSFSARGEVRLVRGYKVFA
jgi:hypothetical protein